jgi:hypothetical protein
VYSPDGFTCGCGLFAGISIFGKTTSNTEAWTYAVIIFVILTFIGIFLWIKKKDKKRDVEKRLKETERKRNNFMAIFGVFPDPNCQSTIEKFRNRIDTLRREARNTRNELQTCEEKDKKAIEIYLNAKEKYLRDAWELGIELGMGV